MQCDRSGVVKTRHAGPEGRPNLTKIVVMHEFATALVREHLLDRSEVLAIIKDARAESELLPHIPVARFGVKRFMPLFNVWPRAPA